MAQASNTKLCLAPHDPWVLKKKLTDSDLSSFGKLYLPKRDFEVSIIPEMGNVMIHNLESSKGIEVKLHIVDECQEAEDYTLTLRNETQYWFRAGWRNIAKTKGYKTGDEIGLMWDKKSTRFLFHHIK